MALIAIDYGKSKCGYAIGSVFVAESGTIKTADLVKKIERYDTVLFGLPLSMSGNYSTQTFEVIKFALKIKNSGKKVLLLDERVTTKMAKSFEKKDDDRFSAEQLLLEYIQNPDRAIELKEYKVLESKPVFCNFAVFIEVPYDGSFSVREGIGFSKDPYIAYTLYKHGIFVYRVWKDFREAIINLEKAPEYVIMNIENRQVISELDIENLQKLILFFKVVIK
ncbi:Holliday junction resolvase RuvX [Fervidobacterium pennivorans subsp. shakshaketiis]|jgi:putative Holliday junction resolvase|uniref:Endonuclease involved in recombination n=1 Tax=Fervidobacterium pennivorans (strain DSM 9078 / Ven5) TaxID=771875 RepID=H9UB95_FERPD|nr:Holliday junction resolvase RuvX [Fervidobacterium pennivorans]AFG34788.1 putative endonuclease involved in recombination [Fervidobacterium pennivorans DSM 9078]QIV78060.1 Holliday junction resolvase RuvX [Fervidobacterium pennivorans subsp. keratinolyticus]